MCSMSQHSTGHHHWLHLLLAPAPTCRGLHTALIEREDFGSGTSSKSTKLVHGGVRYLEKAVFNLDYGQLKLVYEALQVCGTARSEAARIALITAVPCERVHMDRCFRLHTASGSTLQQHQAGKSFAVASP